MRTYHFQSSLCLEAGSRSNRRISIILRELLLALDLEVNRGTLLEYSSTPLAARSLAVLTDSTRFRRVFDVEAFGSIVIATLSQLSSHFDN